ncbi:hypothetical protein V3N99_10245 [Dermatophilaceae bacterium Soc4.6]
MESEKYAAPSPRRRVLTWAGSGLAPTLVLCAALGVVGQVYHVESGLHGGIFPGDGGQGTATVPLSLRIGILLSYPSTTSPNLAPALAVLALTVVSLAHVPTVPVTDRVRRTGAVVAGLVGALGATLAVVVVAWVLTTHGSVADAGGSDSISSFQVDPWDTLAGQGGLGLLTAVIGAGAALLLATGAVGRRSGPAGTTGRGDAGAEAAHSPGATASGVPLTPPGVNGSAPSTPPAPELVVVASPPTVDLAASQRPTSSGVSGATGASEAPSAAGTRELPGSADGYRRPTNRLRDST